jgi:putative ABC transport system permease protein
MFARIVAESLARNPRRKLIAAAAIILGMATATATLTVALEEGDRLAAEFRSLGANLQVTPRSDTLPLEIGGVDYRPVSEGTYLPVSGLGRLKTIFWRNNIIGFTPFLDLPIRIDRVGGEPPAPATLVGTWYAHPVSIPDGTTFTTGARLTHPWWHVEGQWFGDGQAECVVGQTLAARLHIQPGDRLAVRAGDQTVTLRVTGLLASGGAEDDAIVAPLGIAGRLAGRPGQYRRLMVSALTKPEDAFGRSDPRTLSPVEYERWYCSPYISSIARQVEEALPGTDVEPIRRIAATEGQVLSRVSILFWLVTLAALVAVALAVGATAATTMLERRSEVGLMKALGATPGIISGFFLAEQLLIGVVGSLLGYGVGVLLGRELGRAVFGVAATERLVLLPVIVALAAIVVTVGCLVPLRRAARFPPALVLRGE